MNRVKNLFPGDSLMRRLIKVKDAGEVPHGVHATVNWK